MEITCVPLLQIQRDLYARPRGPERFEAYLETMTPPIVRNWRCRPWLQ